MRIGTRTAWWLTCCGVSALAGGALLAVAAGPAAETTTPAGPGSAGLAHEMTAADLEAFLGGLLPVQIERDDIAGAVVAVVKDGRLLFAAGYGWADREKKVPVSPESTLFRPGSVSKLFTWTAVMQQVEAGKVDLEADVNKFLDFTIPASHPQPITLRHLMTHTAGFEEKVKDLFVRDVSQLRPLREYLVERLPARIFPPGTTPAYSNYGTTLAGYIVERAAGQKFEAYVNERIFQPLGMTHSSFAQPLPEPLQPLMSNGYALASKPSKPFEVVQAAPAGSLSASATDMARFMLAHLQDGELEGRRILQPETARLMHSRQFGMHPDLNGMALGFYEESSHGRRIIGHGGDTAWFHSDLHLIPEAGVGFFVSYNSAGASPWPPPRSALFAKFLDRYFPHRPPATPAPASAAEDARAVAGYYQPSRRGETSLLKVAALLGQVEVSANQDGTISVDLLKDPGGSVKRWHSIGPLLFREEGGHERLAFKRDDAGGMRLSAGIFPFFVFDRVGWLESKKFQLPLLCGSLAAFAVGLVLWPVAALVRRHYGRRLELEARLRRSRLAVRLLGLANLGLSGGWAVLLAAGGGDVGLFSRPLDPWLRLLQLAALVSVAAAPIAVSHAVRSWRRSPGGGWSRLADSVLALAFVGFAAFLLQWRLVHWSVDY